MDTTIITILCLTIGAIMAYAVCRLIDHIFTKKEMMDELTCVDYLIPRVSEEVEMLSDKTIDNICKRMLDMTKEMTETWMNTMKEM